MAQGLSKGERPGWSAPSGRAGAGVMDRVADSASAHRVRRVKRARRGQRRAGAKRTP